VVRPPSSLIAALVIVVAMIASAVPADGVAEIADVAAEAAVELDAPARTATEVVAAGGAVREIPIGPPRDELHRSVALGPPPVPPPES
jgi:hypothetical protein